MMVGSEEAFWFVVTAFNLGMACQPAEQVRSLDQCAVPLHKGPVMAPTAGAEGAGACVGDPPEALCGCC